jgi:hypothetical protein
MRYDMKRRDSEGCPSVTGVTVKDIHVVDYHSCIRYDDVLSVDTENGFLEFPAITRNGQHLFDNLEKEFVSFHVRSSFRVFDIRTGDILHEVLWKDGGFMARDTKCFAKKI